VHSKGVVSDLSGDISNISFVKTRLRYSEECRIRGYGEKAQKETISDLFVKMFEEAFPVTQI